MPISIITSNYTLFTCTQSSYNSVTYVKLYFFCFVCFHRWQQNCISLIENSIVSNSFYFSCWIRHHIFFLNPLKFYLMDKTVFFLDNWWTIHTVWEPVRHLACGYRCNSQARFLLPSARIVYVRLRPTGQEI